MINSAGYFAILMGRSRGSYPSLPVAIKAWATRINVNAITGKPANPRTKTRTPARKGARSVTVKLPCLLKTYSWPHGGWPKVPQWVGTPGSVTRTTNQTAVSAHQPAADHFNQRGRRRGHCLSRIRAAAHEYAPAAPTKKLQMKNARVALHVHSGSNGR